MKDDNPVRKVEIANLGSILCKVITYLTHLRFFKKWAHIIMLHRQVYLGSCNKGPNKVTI